MSLERFCKNQPVTSTPSATIEDLARTMLSEHVGAVIVEADDVPIGIVTDRDIVCRALAGGMNPKWVTAQMVMSAPPIVAHVTDTIDSALVRMRQGGVRRLPIVSDDQRICGMVTLDDLLVMLTAELEQLAQVPVNDAGP